MRSSFILRALAPLLAAALPAGAMEIDLALALGRLAGDASYRSGGGIPSGPDQTREAFPISTLEFPLDAPCAEVRATAAWSGWSAGARLGTNLDTATGTVHDRDLGVISGVADSLDIASESRADLRLIDIDLACRRTCLRAGTLALDLGAGLRVQHLDITANDVVQRHPSSTALYGYPSPDVMRSGPVLRYASVMVLPQILAGVRWRGDGVEAGLTAGFAPWARADDEAEHLLRHKRNEGEGEGVAWSAGLSLAGRLGRSSLGLEIETLRLTTVGRTVEGDASSRREIGTAQLRALAVVSWRF